MLKKIYNQFQKYKKCDKCGKDRVIWKSDHGKKYCKACTIILYPPKKPNTPIYRISPVSEKRLIEKKRYDTLRKKFLSENPVCACNEKLKDCTFNSTEVHHKKGRGKYYLDVSKFLAVCHNCHVWITNHDIEAIKNGWSIKRLNKE